MSIPTMEELRRQEQGNDGTTAFNYECAFYHGYMAALKQVDSWRVSQPLYTPNLASFIDNLRDKANADMAAEIGG